MCQKMFGGGGWGAKARPEINPGLFSEAWLIIASLLGTVYNYSNVDDELCTVLRHIQHYCLRPLKLLTCYLRTCSTPTCIC